MKLTFQRGSRLPHWPWWSVLVVGAWGGLVAAAAWLSRAWNFHATLCPFKRLTNLPCPTCGGTRGTMAMLDGDPIQGFLCNPLLFALLAAFAANLLLRLIFARSVRLEASGRERKALWLIFLALIGLNWAYLIHRGM
jgi:hypothetical protein